MEQPTSKGIDWGFTGIERGESALERFWATRKWSFGKIIALVLGTLAIAIPLFVIYRGYFSTMNTRVERSLVITLLLLFAFLKYPSGKRKWMERPNWASLIDLLLIVLAVGAETYTIYDTIVRDMSHTTVNVLGQSVEADNIIGWVLVILVLEATRRSFGWVMVIVPLAFIVYSVTADLWPGPLAGARANWWYVGGMLYSETTGLFGIGISVLLSMVFLFLLFGSFMVSTKVGAFFTSFANGLVGRYAGGPAKVAVVASAFLGSVSGSAIANVATTGCITIPLMKKAGYRPEFAGAVEATASTGGIFTPPIMGAAAFLIATFLNIPYLTVCLYALLPALLYYLAVFIQVHLRAKKSGLAGLPPEQLPSVTKVMMEGGYLLLPAVLLVVALALGYSIAMVTILGTIGVLLVSFFNKNTRQKPHQILLMFEKSSSETVGISLAMIVVGIIEGTAMVSGLGTRLTRLVEALSAGNLVLGLIIAAAVLIILGMGVNPTLVYYIGYIFIIPALVGVGAPEIPVHLFTFIFSAIAGITPPVALAAFTAASIARAPPMRTGFEAIKLGFAAYIVPFLLVFQPALLLLGDATVLSTVVGIVTATLGIGFLAISFEGWLFRNIGVWERLLIFAAGLLQITPSIELSIAGFVVAVLLVVWLWLTARKTAMPQTVA